MHWLKVTACFSICALLLGPFVMAQQNNFGVADKYTVNFPDAFRVRYTLLPKGDYEIRHTMKGEEHIIVFHQLKTEHPIEVSSKCTLVPLPQPASDSLKIYSFNAANERVLRELIFKGDTAKHVF